MGLRKITSIESYEGSIGVQYDGLDGQVTIFAKNELDPDIMDEEARFEAHQFEDLVTAINALHAAITGEVNESVE
jgi:hypothetical protein